MTESPVTVLLQKARGGDESATEELFEAIYDELKVIARSHRRRWHGNETLNATALLNEAFIKLAGRDAGWKNRTHFFATASKAMRQILVNYAERQGAAKRGGAAVRVPLERIELAAEASADELLMVDSLLGKLEAARPQGCRVVECRVFGGMGIDETAAALGVSPSTVKREWSYCSAWLYRALPHPEGAGGESTDRRGPPNKQ